jgi:hypothetical protein
MSKMTTFSYKKYGKSIRLYSPGKLLLKADKAIDWLKKVMSPNYEKSRDKKFSLKKGEVKGEDVRIFSVLKKA